MFVKLKMLCFHGNYMIRRIMKVYVSCLRASKHSKWQGKYNSDKLKYTKTLHSPKTSTNNPTFLLMKGKMASIGFCFRNLTGVIPQDHFRCLCVHLFLGNIFNARARHDGCQTQMQKKETARGQMRPLFPGLHSACTCRSSPWIQIGVVSCSLCGEKKSLCSLCENLFPKKALKKTVCLETVNQNNFWVMKRFN